MQAEYPNIFEIQEDDIENYLPKSLIEDLEQNNDFDSNSTSLNSSITPQLMSPTQSTEDLTSWTHLIQVRHKPEHKNYITKSELLKKLNNQKSTLTLQEKVRKYTAEQVNLTLNEISSSWSQIMKNRNGNYFCSDFFKLFNENQTQLAWTAIQQDFFNWAVNEFSTHPLQVLIDRVALYDTTSEFLLLLLNNSNLINTLAMDTNGAYVVQKIIQVFPENLRAQFNQNMLKYFIVLTLNPHGICVAKKFVEKITNKTLFMSLCTQIANNFHLVSDNKYGNYWVQYMFDLYWESPEMSFIKQWTFINFSSWATKKFSSHLLDNFISRLNTAESNQLLNALVTNNVLNSLYNDKYGCFLIRKIIDVVNNQKCR